MDPMLMIPGRRIGGSGCRQHRQQGPGQVEHGLQVEGEHPFPRFLVGFRQRGHPGVAGVVHEQVQMMLVPSQFLADAQALALGAEISRERGAPPAGRDDLVCEIGERFRLARADVDADSRPGEAGRDQPANALRRPGDQGRPPGEREQVARR